MRYLEKIEVFWVGFAIGAIFTIAAFTFFVAVLG